MSLGPDGHEAKTFLTTPDDTGYPSHLPGERRSLDEKDIARLPSSSEQIKRTGVGF